MRGQDGPINDLAFSADNSCVAVAAEDDTNAVRVYELRTARPVMVLKGHTKAVNYVKVRCGTGIARVMGWPSGVELTGQPAPSCLRVHHSSTQCSVSCTLRPTMAPCEHGV